MALECTQNSDGVIDTFQHPRYEMHGSGAVFDGEAEVRGYFASSRETFPDQTNEVIAIAATGDTVLVESFLMDTHLRPLKALGKTYAPTGRSFKVRMPAGFEFAPGTAKVICERPYTGVQAKLCALGLE